MSSPDNIKDAGEEFVDKLTGDIIVDATHDIDASQDDKESQEASGADANDNAEESAPASTTDDASEKQDDTSDDKPEETGVFSGKKFWLNRAPDALDTVHEANKLQELIVANGGEVLTEEPKEEVEGTFIISPYNITKLPTVTPTYIKASAGNNNAQDIKNYLVPFDEFRAAVDTNGNTEGDAAEAKDKDTNDDGATASEQADQTAAAETEDGPEKEANDDKEEDDEMNLFHDAMDTTPNQSTNLVEDAGTTVVADDTTAAPQTETGAAAAEPVKNYASTNVSMPRPTLHSHNKASFTEAEAEFILDVVRKNPTRRTTHTLFDEISHYVPNHTGNSIRHRFRVYLSKRLEFVYKVDNVGKLIRDAGGNLIKTEIMPPSLKKKFLAEEDYQLALAIKRQFYRDLYQIDPESGSSLINNDDTPTAIAKRNMTMARDHVPGHEPEFQKFNTEGRRGPIAREFFKNFAEDNITHTENAWRDRFRKFILTFGLDNYIEYYEREIAENRAPQPIKNMTNRPKREGNNTPGNYNSSIKRHKGADGTQTSPSGQQSNANHAMNVAAAAAAASSDHGMGNNQRNYPIPENELLDEETMNFISTLKNNLGNIDNGLPFEYPQEIADAIRHDFSIEEAEYDNIDPDTIPFPPEIATIDLFLPTFFQMSNTREFMDKINEVISRDYEPSQAEKLVQDLCDEAGVRKTFSTSILTALSGDLMVFPRYFLNSFKHNANPPMNVPGIWTREDDEMLRGGKDDDMKLLEKKHGAGRIEMRRRFIEKDLV